MGRTLILAVVAQGVETKAKGLLSGSFVCVREGDSFRPELPKPVEERPVGLQGDVGAEIRDVHGRGALFVGVVKSPHIPRLGGTAAGREFGVAVAERAMLHVCEFI
jgi:hypothetical protein